MATASILYVGDDTCRRIPVMGSVGLAVFQSGDSIPAIRNALAHQRSFSAITFHSDISALPRESVWLARALSPSPLVLFENPHVYCEKSDFDLVVPALTHPSCWLKKISDVIEASRKLQEFSRQLRRESAVARPAPMKVA